MDLFEKVEKLVQKTGCSYEDAKLALELTDGDMLEAVIYLERQGQTAPQGGTYSTRYENQPQYVPIAGQNQRGPQQTDWEAGSSKFKNFCRKAWHVLSTNYLIIKRKGELMAKLPFWAGLLILFGSMTLALILVVVSLFFGFTYSFEGEKRDKMQEANKVMDKIQRAAESAREEFRK